ncbi:MAG: hypothetical protein H0V20_04050 [Actinobacteria bacterium]|nr:hypothetical protein [Actinomycetota bacterium]
MPSKRVEILTFDGCPNAQAAEDLVGRVLMDLEIEAEVAAIRVEDADAAERLRFLGSPTIRVAGHDVEPGADARTDYTLACRIYAAEGGLSNLPNEDWVRAALVGRDT